MDKKIKVVFTKLRLANFKNSRIFLAGSSGLIGRACGKVLLEKGYKNLLTPSSKELDLRDSVQVEYFFSSNEIDIVILAAGKVGGIIENKKNSSRDMVTHIIFQQTPVLTECST